MKNNFPLVSVIIPAFNSEKYIAETINSALCQTYRNIELIIVDDGSTDRTLEIVKQISLKDNRVKYFSIPPAGRPSVPRNFGIQKANGEFIAFLDSDDLWIKEKLDYQVKYLLQNQDKIFVYSMCVTFGNVSFFSPFYEVLPLLFKISKSHNDLINKGNSIQPSTVLVRKAHLLEVNGFDEDPELKVEDYDLWIRLSMLGSFGFIPRVLTLYRIHASQFSADWEKKKNRIKYLAKKRNLDLPDYNYYRLKGPLFLIARNFVHTLTYYWVTILKTIDKIFLNK